MSPEARCWDSTLGDWAGARHIPVWRDCLCSIPGSAPPTILWPGPPMRATASPSLLSPVDPPTSEVLQAHTRGNQGVQLSVLLSECVFTDSNEVTKERKFFACPECSTKVLGRHAGVRAGRGAHAGPGDLAGPARPLPVAGCAARGACMGW